MRVVGGAHPAAALAAAMVNFELGRRQLDEQCAAERGEFRRLEPPEPLVRRFEFEGRQLELDHTEYGAVYLTPFADADPFVEELAPLVDAAERAAQDLPPLKLRNASFHCQRLARPPSGSKTRVLHLKTVVSKNTLSKEQTAGERRSLMRVADELSSCASPSVLKQAGWIPKQAGMKWFLLPLPSSPLNPLNFSTAMWVALAEFPLALDLEGRGAPPGPLPLEAVQAAAAYPPVQYHTNIALYRTPDGGAVVAAGYEWGELKRKWGEDPPSHAHFLGYERRVEVKKTEPDGLANLGALTERLPEEELPCDRPCLYCGLPLFGPAFAFVGAAVAPLCHPCGERLEVARGAFGLYRWERPLAAQRADWAALPRIARLDRSAPHWELGGGRVLANPNTDVEDRPDVAEKDGKDRAWNLPRVRGGGVGLVLAGLTYEVAPPPGLA